MIKILTYNNFSNQSFNKSRQPRLLKRAYKRYKHNAFFLNNQGFNKINAALLRILKRMIRRLLSQTQRKKIQLCLSKSNTKNSHFSLALSASNLATKNFSALAHINSKTKHFFMEFA